MSDSPPLESNLEAVVNKTGFLRLRWNNTDYSSIEPHLFVDQPFTYKPNPVIEAIEPHSTILMSDIITFILSFTYAQFTDFSLVV